MQSWLMENLPVQYPGNMHMPHLVSKQIWAHLFIHYWQMLTEGKLKSYMCLTRSWHHQVNFREHQSIPKEARSAEMLCGWLGNTTGSLAFLCSRKCGPYSWVSFCYIHLFNLLKSHVERRISSECFYTFTVAGKYISLKFTCSIYPSHFESGLLKGKFTAWHQEWKNRKKNPYWHIKLDMFAGPPEIAITVLQLLWTDYREKHWLLPGNSTC